MTDDFELTVYPFCNATPAERALLLAYKTMPPKARAKKLAALADKIRKRCIAEAGVKICPPRFTDPTPKPTAKPRGRK